MPVIKSAKKRVNIANKATIRNSKTKRSMKSAVKEFTKSPTSQSLQEAQSKIDTAAKKHVIHKNKAARLKSRLSAQAKTAGVKPTTKKKSPAKPTKSSPKTATKKPAAKKATTKASAKKS